MSLAYISCPIESQIVLLLLMWGVYFHNSSHGKMLQSCTLYNIPFVRLHAKDVPKLACQTYGELGMKSGKRWYDPLLPSDTA